MKILILGATGLTGAQIRRTLDVPGNHVHGTCRRPDAGMCQYNLDDGRLEELLKETGPEVVVSCLRGDYGKQLEAHKAAADFLAERGGKMIYLSTANVFDAETDRPHYEEDPPRAESDYGRFKITCERLLQERLKGELVILRLPEVWGRNAPRLRELVEADRTGAAVPVYVNDRINFTTDCQAAAWTDYILRQDLRGIFHVGTQDECTHGEFRRRLAEALGLKHIRWAKTPDAGCQSILPGRKEIPPELHTTVDEVLRRLAP